MVLGITDRPLKRPPSGVIRMPVFAPAGVVKPGNTCVVWRTSEVVAQALTQEVE
jgi:hypothetical protein